VLEEIRSINPTAPLKTAKYSNIGDLKWLLDAKCFDVDRAKDVETAFAALNLHAETSTDDSHHQHAPCHDTSCNTCPKSYDHSDDELYCGECTSDVATDADSSDLQRYGHIHTSSVGTVALIQMGSVNLKRTHAWLASILWPNQDEDEGVVRSRLEQSLESNTNDGTVATRIKNEKTMQIFRIKGILSIQHPTENGVVMVDNEMLEEQPTLLDGSGRDPRRYIVQAVNDLWEIHPASDSLRWEDEERCCKLVVIGRYLDREALTQGFQDCASQT
jgi:G3E family GTPase